jgi:hypothetical protein
MDLWKNSDDKRPGAGVDFSALLPLLAQSEHHFAEAAEAAAEEAAAAAAAEQAVADAVAARVKMGFSVDPLTAPGAKGSSGAVRCSAAPRPKPTPCGGSVGGARATS